jgi:transposase
MDLLNLQGLIPGDAIESETSISVRVLRRRDKLPGCTHCGSEAIAPNGTRLVTYMDLPVRGKPVTIEWERQRFRCRELLCRKTSADQSEHLHENFQVTTRLYDWIGNRCLTQTFAAVASDTGLDERSVRRIFEHWSDAKLDAGHNRVATPRILGIDEVHLLRHARGVLTNIEQRTLIDLLPDRSRETMRRRLIRMDRLDTVQVVTMDMWRPYRDLAAELMPRAVVVVDKWHVTKYADKGMETIRKSHRAGLSAPMRKRLVKDRFLLLSRGSRLRPEQRLIMQTWTHHFPDLAAAYAAKEAFYGIYDCATRREAEAVYAAWEASLTKEMRAAFAELLSAMKNWREPIFNYFDHRVTNAYTEAMNGLIKIANRAGRGYSFEVLRARMLLNYRAIRHPQLPDEPARGVPEFAFKRAIFDNPRHFGFDLATTASLLDGLIHEVTSTESAG